MLSGIRVRNFKAFDELDIELKPITLFLGPNNSGKSSILAAIRLLAQTIKNDDPDIPLLFRGMMGDFGTYKDVVHGNQSETPMEIGVLVPPIHPNDERWGMEISENDLLKVNFSYAYEQDNRQLLLNNIVVEFNDHPVFSTFSRAEGFQLIETLGGQPIPVTAEKFQLIIETPFPGFRAILASAPFHSVSINDKNLNITNLIFPSVEEPFNHIEYIGAIRSRPERTYQFTGAKPSRIGLSGENAVAILEVTSINKDGQKVIEDIKTWLANAGIASDVRIEALTDRHYEIQLQHPNTQEYQNLVDVGMGNSQVLPILVGGFGLESGYTYIVEEPEIRLHPRAQAELASFLLTLYKRGVQSLVETHSEHLVVRLQQYVASGKIPPEDVCVYYVYAKEGKKAVQQLRLDKWGQFMDEWPEGFFPERLAEAKNLARIRYQAQTIAG